VDWLTEGLNDLNYWLVLLAGVVTMAIGYVWYHDKMFGVMWRKENKLTKTDVETGSGMGPMMIQALVLGLVGQSVLFGILIASGTSNTSDAITLAIVLGFAFNFTTIAINNLYARRNMALSAIDGGFQIIALVAGAVIFSLLG